MGWWECLGGIDDYVRNKKEIRFKPFLSEFLSVQSEFLRCDNMIIHFCNILIHIDWHYLNI